MTFFSFQANTQATTSLLRQIVLSALLLPAIAATAAVDADRQLKTLYEQEHSWHQQQLGKRLDETGKWLDGPDLPQVDALTRQARLDYWESIRSALEDIPNDALSDDEQINAAVFRQILDTRINDHRYRTYEAPLNSDT
ncbi:MAG: DUF885 domain-containing protein, partial [Fuerstiella sp.]|nr:DUF885 domain-containing protein [Fuerstiella sp.]